MGEADFFDSLKNKIPNFQSPTRTPGIKKLGFVFKGV